MSLRLRALELHIPGWVARSALRQLFDATASAFGHDPVDVHGLTHGELLERYAVFTTSRAEQALADRSDADAVAARMWSSAYVLGASLRRRLGVRTRAEALRAARVAYRMLAIDLRADEQGSVVVDRCAFATWYSPGVCRLMSSLDAGLLAGLTHGGRLRFSERITEGRPRCLATISWQGNPPWA
jgi:hypothetical protein